MNKINSKLPVLVISGASGFVGKYFVKTFCKNYFIYALARRSQQSADVPFSKNIFWIRLDLADNLKVKNIFKKISANGNVDFFLHLAGHFGFRNKKNNPEYERTNVIGTKNILESVHLLNIKRFIFSSSLALFEISDPNRIITENSNPDSTTPYALTKKKAEQLIENYSSEFPCTIIRFAAIYSDWCEHPPLYSFLSTWLSNRWDRRILVGNGKTAIPYLHIFDLIKLYESIFAKTESLPQFHNITASPNHFTSHEQLYKMANNFNYHYDSKPIFLPKRITFFALAIRNLLKFTFGKTYFERLWMLKYTDCIMNVDASHSHNLLSWEPTKRYYINRRLLFLIWNMKTNPIEWHRINKMRFYAMVERQYLKIYDAMLRMRDQIVDKITEQILSDKNIKIFKTYQKLEFNKLRHRAEYIYKMLEFDICTGDRSHILDYAKNLGNERYYEGFSSQEVINAVKLCADVIVSHLSSETQLSSMKQRINDEIKLTLQMVIDEIEDTYEELSKNS